MLGEKLLGKKRRPEVGKILETQDGKFRVMIFTEKEFGIGAGSFGKCYLGRILFENDGNA